MALKYPKPDYVYKSRALTQEPCSVFSIVVTAMGGGTAIIRIHSGPSASAPVVLDLYVSTPESELFWFPEGLYLSAGCYVEIIQNVHSVTVAWKNAG